MEPTDTHCQPLYAAYSSRANDGTYRLFIILEGLVSSGQAQEMLQEIMGPFDDNIDEIPILSELVH